MATLSPASAVRLLILVLALLLTGSAHVQAEGTPPNIIVVLVDDMGCADLGCYGNKDVQTPNIDRLAAEGVKFSNFYSSSPICSPSRTAWLTGRFPSRFRINSYLAHRELNAERGMPNWLPADTWTLADGMKSRGYATGHFGKWHMGGQRDVGEAPLITEYGFDASLTNFEGLGDRVLPLLENYKGDTPKRHALGSDKLGRGNITWMNRDQVTGAFADRAIEFIKTARKENKPFFINLWPDDVHSPFFPSEARSNLQVKRERYLAVLNEMDTQLGKLFDLLRSDEALRSNTVVVFTSDNGPEMGAGSAAPYRGLKGRLYDGGIREPLIVWAPGLISSQDVGKSNQESWLTTVDVDRSLLQLAGVTVPADVKLDGEDLSQTLLGKASQSRVAPAFWVRPPDHPGRPDAPLPDVAVREGKWKLLCMQDGSEAQLYDLDADPREQQNMASISPDKTKELTQKAVTWFADVFKGEFPARSYK